MLLARQLLLCQCKVHRVTWQRVEVYSSLFENVNLAQMAHLTSTDQNRMLAQLTLLLDGCLDS
jgi:hypothetical protein